MKCRFCAEVIPVESESCPFCGEATASKTTLADIVSRLRPKPDQAQVVVLLVAGLTLALSPFLPGLSFTISPTLDPGLWRSTVSSAYFESLVPLVLPLIGVAIVVSGVRRSSVGRHSRKQAALLASGVAATAVAVWSFVSLYRVGQNGTEKFGAFSFSRSMHIEFGIVAPWVVLLVGLLVTGFVVRTLPRRAPAAVVLVLAMVGGGVAGALADPLQSPDRVLERAADSVDEYEERVAAEQAAERAQQRQEAQDAESAAIGDCAGVVMGWVIAAADGRVDANQIAFAIGMSSPLVDVIFNTFGSFYSTAAQKGVDYALGAATNIAVDKCRNSEVREAAQIAPRAP